VAKFVCTRCGGCCASLLTTTPDGHIFGIYLEPSEIDRFPADAIFPLCARGPLDSLVVTAYQLGANRCPNFEEHDGVGKCLIHERRPIVCRAYPVISRYRVSPACLAVKRADGIDLASLTEEMAAHQKKLDRLLCQPPNEWVWPLNKKCWVPIQNGVLSS
jgi:Fe-S-cluster containining protein